MKCLFIYNPFSGKSKILKKKDYITSRLKEKFEVVDVYETKGPKDLTVKAKEACGVYDYLVFAGGDGSFNELINGIASEPVRPIVGCIPVGTVNDIAKSNKISKNVKKALDIILNGKVTELDVMQANSSYAIYVLAAGSFTACSYETKQSKKKKMGKLAYIFEIIKNELKIKTFPIKLEKDGEVKELNSSFIMVINSRSVGGMPVHRKANLSDGTVDVLIYKQKENPKFFTKMATLFRILKLFLFGYNSLREKHFIKFSSNAFSLTVPKDYCWNVDGEAGVNGKIEFKVHQKNLKLMTKKGKKD